ncbi:glycerophosphodiester phosphodiesterase family protein [Pseudoduganella armeniaca]|uniref:glycerophosphodiester phosphodiesterase n=1 Tax=Pseudoduganella armeniaca TaxID=2072590 RepID=A0A2R4CEJ8_9BURK|nr:glycerophosphodiester phosphodiesterase family protein [Pseudoduganella armeniaca]AVR98046.1 glycerophosphodiester phosphodiesterase [Pseudoduganella armeniaca]
MTAPITRHLSRRGFIAAAAGTAGALLLPRAQAAEARAKPLVFAHRGASALRPEHTLAAYSKAIADGADYIEPDLVCTRDGVLVARHEADLTETTDVAKRPEFASRRTRKTFDGETHTGWFVDDFTLAELKTLRAVERIPQSRPGSAQYDGMFQLLTFEEVIDFVAAQSATTGRLIGLVPELKSSTYFAAAKLALEDRFIATLAAHEYTRRAPVEIQSFEVANLRYLRDKLGRRANLRLMQLVGVGAMQPSDVVAVRGKLTYAEMATPRGLRDVASYADTFAPPTRALIPLKKDGSLDAPTALAADVHAAGLRLETWTFRPENRFLAADFRDGAGEHARNEAGSVAEMRRYLQLGLDGLFTDDPALGRKAVDG